MSPAKYEELVQAYAAETAAIIDRYAEKFQEGGIRDEFYTRVREVGSALWFASEPLDFEELCGVVASGLVRDIEANHRRWLQRCDLTQERVH